MDLWRDYPKFIDGARDAFIKRFPFCPTTPPQQLSQSVGAKSAIGKAKGGADQIAHVPFIVLTAPDYRSSDFQMSSGGPPFGIFRPSLGFI